jgi:branched-chain amino acid transport system substrate-binding protein
MMATDFVAAQEFSAAWKTAYLAGGGTIIGESFTPFARTQDYGPYICRRARQSQRGVRRVFRGRGADLRQAV